MGLELEGIAENTISISITADRPDLVSLHGMSRAIKAYRGWNRGLPEYTVHKGKYVIDIEKEVEEVRPFTAAAVVKNLQFTDATIKEMIWVQEKLHDTFARGRKKGAIGIYPLEKITWPITYTALDPKKIVFRPLESDRVMTGQEILEKHPTGILCAHLLKGKKVYPIFRDAKGEILSMPPIINSHTTGKVTVETTDIFIECSGHSFATLHSLLKILVTMFSNMGGDVYDVELHYPDKKMRTPDLTPEKATLKIESINKILGHAFTEGEAQILLERMLYGVAKKGKDTLIISIPPFRTDIWHEIDIIDDVARAYGLNNLKPHLPSVSTIGELLPETEAIRKIEKLLIGCNLTQVFTLALTSKETQFQKMTLPESEHIDLGTTAEKSLNMVRVHLLPELLTVFSENRNREYPQRVFEIEDVILPDKGEDCQSKNVKRIAVAICHSQASFTEGKQILSYLFDTCGIPYELKEEGRPEYIRGRGATIIVKKKKVGSIGELSPHVLTNFGLDMPVVAFEIDLQALLPWHLS
jgi:phenylalanyl-tRNA synthetase beta chain